MPGVEGEAHIRFSAAAKRLWVECEGGAVVQPESPWGCGADATGKDWCRGRDLNPYGLAATSPSSWRVYLFLPLAPGCSGAAASSRQSATDSNPRHPRRTLPSN